MLTDLDIQRRLPVWHAFSDCFLDTELQPADYVRIAAALRDSGFERTELQSILNDEVAPVFVRNLIDIAGEWSGWSAEQVLEIMLPSLNSQSGIAPLTWLKRRALRRHLAHAWSKIEPLLADSGECPQTTLNGPAANDPLQMLSDEGAHVQKRSLVARVDHRATDWQP